MTHPIRRNLEDKPNRSQVLNGNYNSDFLFQSYEALYLGHSCNSELRANGSSGGVGSTILQYILDEKIVDAVIAVGFNSRDKWKPEYKLVESSDQIHTLTGSKYVFMELSELKNLVDLNTHRSLAIVVQPCHTGIIRNWQKKNPNIKIVLSFFCGYNITIDATHYLLRKANVKHQDISEVSYRGGEYPGGFTINSVDGQNIQYGKEFYELIDLKFLKNGCARCPYYMGENADIVLGDAWIKEHKNLTALIARTPLGTKLLTDCHRNQKIKLFEFKELELLKMHWHNLKYKKYGQTPTIRMITWLIKKIPEPLIPFYFLGFLSRMRRKFKIGISKPNLNPIEITKP